MTDLDPLNEFLDGDAPNDANLDGVPKEEIARHLLVEAATRHLLHEQTVSTADLVRENMRVVIEDEAVARRRRFRNVAFATLAAAAAVVVTTLILFSEPPSLKPLIGKIQDFVTKDIDREYNVKAQSKTIGGELLAQSMRLQLFTRGADKFAARLEFGMTRNDAFEVWMGTNGEEHWIVLPVIEFLQLELPVIVSDQSLDETWKSGELGMVEQFARRMVRAEASMMVFSLLANLETNYNLAKTPEKVRFSLPEGQSDVTATRHPQADITIPDSIRMVVDDDSGAVRKIILKFIDLPGEVGVENPFRSIHFDLVGETMSQEEIYEHAAHHGPDREIVRR